MPMWRHRFFAPSCSGLRRAAGGLHRSALSFFGPPPCAMPLHRRLVPLRPVLLQATANQHCSAASCPGGFAPPPSFSRVFSVRGQLRPTRQPTNAQPALYCHIRLPFRHSAAAAYPRPVVRSHRPKRHCLIHAASWHHHHRRHPVPSHLLDVPLLQTSAVVPSICPDQAVVKISYVWARLQVWNGIFGGRQYVEKMLQALSKYREPVRTPLRRRACASCQSTHKELLEGVPLWYGLKLPVADEKKPK